MIDISEICLESERLLLRAWREDDLEDFYTYASIAGVGEMAGWKHHESKVETEKILRMFINDKNCFAIVLKAKNTVIGSLGLHTSWSEQHASYQHLNCKEIGYVLSKDYWGKGFMVEAVCTVIDYCFNQLSLDAVSISHFDFNNQSKRVIEKVGFRFIEDSIMDASQLQKQYRGKRYLLLKEKSKLLDVKML